jgi:hypothetical protein
MTFRFLASPQRTMSPAPGKYPEGLFMSRMVTRAEIAEVLRNWQSGLWSAQQVHNWADDLFFPGEVDFDDEEPDEESVACVVLRDLSMLNMNLRLSEDISIYLEFLGTPPGRYAEGYAKYATAIKSIDNAASRRELHHDPFYAPFCQEFEQHPPQ